jgi:hypothetical protein
MRSRVKLGDFCCDDFEQGAENGPVFDSASGVVSVGAAEWENLSHFKRLKI